MSWSTGSRSIVRNPGGRLGPSDLEAAAGKVDVADERVADLVIARPGENERRDQRVAARRSRLRVPVQLARRIEQRDDLINPIEVHRSGFAGLQLASSGIDPDRVAGDQLVLDRNLENLPEAGDRLGRAV
jgi:hypothetical protein